MGNPDWSKTDEVVPAVMPDETPAEAPVVETPAVEEPAVTEPAQHEEGVI